MLQQVKTIVKKIPGSYSLYQSLKQLKNKQHKKSLLSKPKLLPQKSIEKLKAEFVAAAKNELENFLASPQRSEFIKTERPKVSIVIPVYNKDYFTYRCLKNLLQFSSQSAVEKGAGIEVVIIDNNSTDQTRKLLEKIDNIKVIKNQENLHFLKASNQGAKAALGEYLLFLNNDAEPDSGAILEALKVFKQYQNVGTVGGKLILPDGRLQEAGSILWSDGTCVGYARGQDPDNGLFNFIREVDYCSGAFLMTPRELFLKVNCFDERFAPAYYEEADYCVAVKKLGFINIYNPDVKVSHFEFGSSTLSDQAFELMTKNRAKFYEKNKDFLASKGQATLVKEKPDSVELLNLSNLAAYRKRVLYIDERLPQIKTGAGYPRANAVVKQLAEMGYYVTVYPLMQQESEVTWEQIREDIPNTVELCVFGESFNEYGLAGFKKFYEKRKGFYDVVWVSRPTTMEELRKLSPQLTLFDGVKLIYDAEALFSIRDINLEKLRGKPLSAEAQEKLISKELANAKGCRSIVCVSEQEATQYKNRGFVEVNVLSHAVLPASTESSCDRLKDAGSKSITKEEIDFESRSGILFVGAVHADYTPNADSMVWFIQEILPLVNQKLSLLRLDAVKLKIVGVNNSSIICSLAAASNGAVEVVGAVDSLKEWYAKSRIFVAPTRFAAGIPLKIIEASAYGIPSVVSQLIHEQLVWREGQDYLVGADPKSFADKVIELYLDQEIWKRVQDGAGWQIAENYSVKAFGEKIKRIVGE